MLIALGEQDGHKRGGTTQRILFCWIWKVWNRNILTLKNNVSEIGDLCGKIKSETTIHSRIRDQEVAEIVLVEIFPPVWLAEL